MGKYFQTDGIRGRAEMFTGDFIEKVVRGLGVDGKRVLIGGDTRESTERILEYLEHSLDTGGATEIGNVGVMPTPAISFACFYLGYDYAIDVTASHNPYTENGLKVFELGENSSTKLSEEKCGKIEKAIDDDSPLGLPMQTETSVVMDHERTLKYYMEHLLNATGSVDLAGMKVALDFANGAMGVVGGRIFERLGAEVVTLSDNTNYGTSINDGVGSTHIGALQKEVSEGDYSFGAAFDGDGDRCILVDEKGAVVDGDQILVVLAEHWKLKGVVSTVMANQGLLNWGKERGKEVLTTELGDQNVARAMREKGYELGGEQSGHIILPGETTGDGMLTALAVAKALKESGKKLSELTSVMNRLPQILVNIPASPEQKELFKNSERCKEIISEFETRAHELEGRILVRPSGTESLLRITMWGNNQEAINSLATELAGQLKEALQDGSN